MCEIALKYVFPAPGESCRLNPVVRYIALAYKFKPYLFSRDIYIRLCFSLSNSTVYLFLFFLKTASTVLCCVSVCPVFLCA